MNTLIAKIEQRDKSQFKVKFTGKERNKRLSCGKEMILGQRGRAFRDFNTFTTHTINLKPEIQQSLEEDSNSSKRDLKPELTTPKVIEYTQINSSAITTEFDVLSSFFDYDVSFKLIYRASNHAFSVKQFHDMCDGAEDTLTICLTEDNKVIGGYTPLSWEDHFNRNSTHFKTDFKRETFVFSVSDKIKYPLVKSLKNKAICCFKAYGPTFGGGYDLLIGDRSNQLPSTTSYFPRNFQHPNLNKFNKRDFTGTSRKNFKVQEWEVFQVIKLHSLKTVQNYNFSGSNDSGPLGHRRGLFDRLKNGVRDCFNSLLSD